MVDDLRDFVESRIMLVLSVLLEAGRRDTPAGSGILQGCPKRTGGNGDLFGESKQDRCTDPKCFQDKLRAFLDFKRKGLKGKGGEVRESRLSITWNVVKAERTSCCRGSGKQPAKGCESPQAGLVVHGKGVGEVKRSAQIRYASLSRVRQIILFQLITRLEWHAGVAVQATRRNLENKVQQDTEMRLRKAILALVSSL